MALQNEVTAERTNLRLGAIVALTLLVSSGTAYRMASARLTPDNRAPALPRGTLERLPMSIGQWVGSDVSLGKELVRATDTDDHVSRSYTKRSGRARVSLFIGYGVRLRDLAPHRPEVCYSGSGWTLDSTSKSTLDIGGDTLTCQVHRFHRGGFGTQRTTVLNYYIVDGRHCSDVSILRSKAWRFDTDANYVAQVQIACSSAAVNAQCVETVEAFARDSAQPILRSLVESIEQARADTEESLKEESPSDTGGA